MDTPKNPHLNQAPPPPPKKYLPIFLPKKIPESKLSDPKKVLRSSPSLEIRSTTPPPPGRLFAENCFKRKIQASLSSPSSLSFSSNPCYFLVLPTHPHPQLSYSSSSSSSNHPHQRRPSPHPILIPIHLNPLLSSPTSFLCSSSKCSSKSDYLHAILITVILSLTVIPPLYSSCSPLFPFYTILVIFILVLILLYFVLLVNSILILILYLSSLFSSSSSSHPCQFRPPRHIHPHCHPIFVLLIVSLTLIVSYFITYLVPCLPTSSSFLLIILIHTLTEMAFCESVWRTRTTILF